MTTSQSSYYANNWPIDLLLINNKHRFQVIVLWWRNDLWILKIALNVSKFHDLATSLISWSLRIFKVQAMLGKPDVPFHKVFKPECNDCWSLSHVHKTTCHIQRVLYKHEPCQHLAGTSVVEKCVGALTDPTDNHNVILDLLGFDGWPASYGLTETAKGNRWAVGTICHTLHETNFVGEICSNKIFSLARDRN